MYVLCHPPYTSSFLAVPSTSNSLKQPQRVLKGGSFLESRDIALLLAPCYRPCSLKRVQGQDIEGRVDSTFSNNEISDLPKQNSGWYDSFMIKPRDCLFKKDMSSFAFRGWEVNDCVKI